MPLIGRRPRFGLLFLLLPLLSPLSPPLFLGLRLQLRFPFLPPLELLFLVLGHGSVPLVKVGHAPALTALTSSAAATGRTGCGTPTCLWRRDPCVQVRLHPRVVHELHLVEKLPAGLGTKQALVEQLPPAVGPVPRDGGVAIPGLLVLLRDGPRGKQVLLASRPHAERPPPRSRCGGGGR